MNVIQGRYGLKHLMNLSYFSSFMIHQSKKRRNLKKSKMIVSFQRFLKHRKLKNSLLKKSN
jgi:hypothetical protein